MSSQDPTVDLSSQLRTVERSWDVRVGEAPGDGLAGALKRGIRLAFRKGFGPPLDRQADLNWHVYAALAATRDVLAQIAAAKADRAESDAQGARLEGLRLESERRWSEAALAQDVAKLASQQEADRGGTEASVARLAEENAVLAARLAAAEAKLAAREAMLARLERLDVDGLELRLGRLERAWLAIPATATTPMSVPVVAPAPAEQPADTGRASIDYFKFETRFRGPRDEIRSRHEPYVAHFRAGGPVLDIGFGRGEFLEALRDAGIAHKGVDAEPDMVAYCKAIGLDVDQGTAHAYLSGLPDASLGGVFLGQVVEHMTPERVADLLGLCAAKIRPGGTFIAETPNPICPTALANFFIDPTHVRPLHPELFGFLAAEAGFRDVEFRFSSVLGDGAPSLASTRAQCEGSASYMDYALIAVVPAGEP
jgi:2-polyprenyl-3-methyl-5-hydroxy-6-metoxy-1,4-benzoquinol methylase